jgi:hypothetical protein
MFDVFHKYIIYIKITKLAVIKGIRTKAVSSVIR